MIFDKGIPIRNVYYMLTYAFKELRRNNYESIAGEDFEDIHDLFAEIIAKGVSYLLKQGLHKEYIGREDIISTVRGKLNLQRTIREKITHRPYLACEYDELTVDNIFNRILKSTVSLLLRQKDVKTERKNSLRKLLVLFGDVSEIAPCNIPWHRLRYDRNTRTYQMLHTLCYLLLQHQLLTDENGDVQMPKFSDEQMNLLFQRFVLEYYKRHHPEFKASAKQIKWNLTEETATASSLLPIMQSDITLQCAERTLIIDTKYYGNTLTEHFGKNVLNSANFYQIYTYVMNEDWHHTGKVDGMLLYARTQSDIQPDEYFKSKEGNILMFKTLDLNQKFDGIKSDLEQLVKYDT